MLLLSIRSFTKGAFTFYVDKGEGGRGFPNVYASTQASLNKLSMEREGGVKKSQKFVFVECEQPPKSHGIAV